MEDIKYIRQQKKHIVSHISKEIAEKIKCDLNNKNVVSIICYNTNDDYSIYVFCDESRWNIIYNHLKEKYQIN